MNTEESRIRAIEQEIDKDYKKNVFLKVPTSIAIQYLLLAFEYEISPYFYRKGEIPRFYSSSHALLQANKEALMESMNWLGEIEERKECEIISTLDPSVYEKAKKLLELGNAYHGAVSAYTMWSRGLANAILLDDTTVRFEYNPDQVSYDVLDMMLSERNRSDHLENMDGRDNLIMSRAKSIVENTVKQIDNNIITYSLREIDKREMMAVSLKLTRGFMSVPNNWKMFEYNRSELNKFWAALLSIGMLHQFAVFYAFKNFSFENDLMANMIIIRPTRDLCRQLSGWTALSRSKVEGMLRYHTYSSHHQKPDIILTPFVKVSDKHLAISPNLMITNNFSRNFIKHLAKNYKEDFDKNSYVFADDMINKIKTNIKNKNVLVKSNIKLPDRGMPDIDVCLVDAAKCEIMLCECKWTIPAADPYEVGDKVDIEKEKLSQTVRLKNYIMKHAEKLSEFINLDRKIIFKEIFFVVVFENHVGSAITISRNVPMIDMKIFVDMINDNDSLKETFKAMKNREYLPKKGVHFKIKEEMYKIGKYMLLWTGYYP